VLGSRVRIGSGAAIIGGVTIGDNVIIVANSVIVDDVESNSIVGGNPARVLKTEIDINEYIN
jgi:serine O-acetyltransferase